jgi:hypothetical protein
MNLALLELFRVDKLIMLLVVAMDLLENGCIIGEKAIANWN